MSDNKSIIEAFNTAEEVAIRAEKAALAAKGARDEERKCMEEVWRIDKEEKKLKEEMQQLLQDKERERLKAREARDEARKKAREAAEFAVIAKDSASVICKTVNESAVRAERAALAAREVVGIAMEANTENIGESEQLEKEKGREEAKLVIIKFAKEVLQEEDERTKQDEKE